MATNESTNVQTNISSDDNPLDNNSPTNESNDIEIKYDEDDNKSGHDDKTSSQSIELVTTTVDNSQSTEKQSTNDNITQTQEKPTQIIITPPQQLQKMNSQTKLIPQSSQLSSSPDPSPSPVLSVDTKNDHTDIPPLILTPSGIRLQKYDFSKLVPDRISCCEHFVMFLTTISLWLVLTTSIAYIITGNPDLFAFIVPPVMIANIIMVCCNPIYFISFRYKYHPISFNDIAVNEDQNTDIINPSLTINTKNVLTIETGGKNVTKNDKYIPARPTKWKVRQRALNRLFGFFLIAMLCIPSLTIDNEQHGWRKFFSVLFCVLIIFFDIKLIAHFIVYYKRRYWIYNGVIWLVLSLIQILIMINYVKKFDYTAVFIGFALGMLLFECALGKYSSNIYKRQILYNLSPTRFAKPFEYNISFNTTIKEVDPKNPRKRFNTRTVGCCCNRIICGFKTCLRIQVTTSAAAFWGFWGIIYVSQAKFLVFPVCLYLYCVLVWNPWYYYKSFDKLHEQKCFCTCKKWCYYICATPSVLIGGFLNTIFIFQCITAFVTRSDKLINDYMTFYIIAFIIGTFCFYFPSTGYCFHTVPVHFVMSHLVTAIVLFLAPVGILIDSINVDFLAQYVDDDPLLAVLISSIIVVTFLSVSGACCSCYRFKKSLVESQAYLTTSTGFSKGMDTIEEPMTIIRMLTFMLTFIDFLTDSVWTFSPNTFRTDWQGFKAVAISLWILQIFVQLISVLSTISTLRKRLDDNKKLVTYMGELRSKLCSNACICILGCWFYPIIWIFYVIFMTVLSLALAVTKLLAIKQVREWWLSWIIYGYYDKSKHSVRDLTPTVDNDNIPKLDIKTQSENVVVDEMMNNDNAKGIWKLYYWIENQTPKSWLEYKINASVYNNYLISELIVESIPLLVLNLVNASNNKWTFISYLSAISSAAFILYGLLKIAYYVGLKNYDLAKFVL